MSALLTKNETGVLHCLESEIIAWQIEDKPVAFFLPVEGVDSLRTITDHLFPIELSQSSLTQSSVYQHISAFGKRHHWCKLFPPSDPRLSPYLFAFCSQLILRSFYQINWRDYLSLHSISLFLCTPRPSAIDVGHLIMVSTSHRELSTPANLKSLSYLADYIVRYQVTS